MLCSICQKIILTKENTLMDEDGTILCVHHPTASSLQNSAIEGCHICALVWERLASCQQKLLLELSTDRNPITNMFMATPQTLELDLHLFGTESLILGVSFDVGDEIWNLPGGAAEKTNMFVLQPSELLDDLTLTTPSGDNTASDESWNLATKWLKTCESMHSKCTNAQTASPWYPTRLVDIGEPSITNARLIITSETSPNGAYVTLSHCWGSARALELTSSRLADLLQLIPLDELPLTFKEALEVTRRLGFRYIWIDSLCIMQDSREDWLFEAELMHKVYSHSYCAIAAAASTDNSQGLFRQRKTHYLYPCETAIPWFSNNDQRKYQLIDFMYWESQIQEQPLHRRGWVVQERLLAPRVLHFSAQQIVWECRELDAAEKYPKGLPKVLGGTKLALFKGLDPKQDGARLRNLSSRDPDPKFHGHHLWDKIVSAYTHSSLTFEDDKLIALSGIAKRQQVELGDEYVAGLWKMWLPSQLLWHVDRCRQIDNSPSVRPEQYRAPSWSWASVDGVISPGGFCEGGFLIDILEISVTPATSDTTGLLKSGFIRIRGVLKELRLKRHEFLDKYWWMTVNDMDIRKKGEKEWERLGPLVHLDVNEAESSLAGMKYCMPVRAPSEYNALVSGLILEPTGLAKGQFRRIGFFQAVEEELHSMILERHENESHLPCESYDTETRTHKICII